MLNFKPVILGTDLNAYGTARAFYEAYGVRSLCLGIRPLIYTRQSKILDVETNPNFEDDAVFLSVLEEVGQRFQEPLVLITCGDGYTALLTRHKKELAKRYRFNYVDPEMQQRLENKKDFYAVCEKYGLPYPKTYILHYEDRDHFETPFAFPMALKANDSIAFLEAEFPGKKKAYCISSEEELRETVATIYASTYHGDLILQDFIPGDTSKMYVLNAYVNTSGKVKMMCLGKCLLDECLPEAIGNYTALVSMGNTEIYRTFQKFLEDIGYRGFANFDLKYDERDNTFKVFEINIRQGRSSSYMLSGGCNYTQYLVEDLIEGKDLPVHYHEDSALWLYVDPKVLRKYCSPVDRPLAERMLREGYFFPTWYEKDRSLARYLLFWRRRIATLRYYPKFCKVPEER